MVRAGHTEAAVDLARMAGLAPCAVICEVLNDDGTIARGPELDRLAADHDLARVTIDDLVAYRQGLVRPGVRVSVVS
jgi:3,4-dihydroxy 2-butanone 4-phosphate synthase/GTP cyclohydrolase II